MSSFKNEYQNIIFRNIKKVGWFFSTIALVIICAGIVLAGVYGAKFYSNKVYEEFQVFSDIAYKINNLPPIDDADTVREQIESMVNSISLGLLSLDNLIDNYFKNFNLALNLLISGIIAFICIRIFVNVILIFRAWDDKMSVHESNSIFASSAIHLFFVIVCQVLIIVAISFIIPQFFLKITEQFVNYLDATRLLMRNSNEAFTRAINTNDHELYKTTALKVQKDLEVMHNYYFKSMTPLNKFNGIVDVLMQGGQLQVKEVLNKLKEIILNTIWTWVIILCVFIGLWAVFDVSNSIAASILVNKYEKKNNRFITNKRMFNQEETKHYHHV